ncbi:MAG: carbohydrate ABC transporter permease [Haloferacaceae archaeon]
MSETATTTEPRGITSRFLTWMESLSEETYAYLLLVPSMLVLSVIAFWPLLETVRMSLYADQLFSGAFLGEFVGLENYVKVLTNENPLVPRPFLDLSGDTSLFKQALPVTILFAVVTVVFETLLGWLMASLMARDYRGRRWVRVAIILPWAIPIVIQGMIFFLLFRPAVGFLTGPLQALGVFSSTPLQNSVDSFIIVAVADIWKTSAFMALLILAGRQSISDGLYDVADVAGATAWQRFRYITLPLVFPALVVAMLFRTMQAMRVYGVIEATGAGCTTVPSLSCMVVESMFGATQAYGTAAVAAVLTAVIIGIVVSVYIVALGRTSGGAGPV